MIRRRRKAGTPEQEAARKDKYYFSGDTHNAIVEYQKEKDIAKRNAIYVKRIAPAFDKLTENLINIHRFVSLHDTYEVLKADCVCFLFEALGKFNPERGTNAFSYYNCVAKNFLIIRTKNKVNNNRKFIQLDDQENLTLAEHRLIEEHCIVPSQDTVLEYNTTANNILDILSNIRFEAKTDNELSTVNGIIEIFSQIDDIDILNKSSCTLYLRELTGLSTKQLNTAIASIKKMYKERKEENDEDYV